MFYRQLSRPNKLELQGASHMTGTINKIRHVNVYFVWDNHDQIVTKAQS